MELELSADSPFTPGRENGGLATSAGLLSLRTACRRSGSRKASSRHRATSSRVFEDSVAALILGREYRERLPATSLYRRTPAWAGRFRRALMNRHGTSPLRPSSRIVPCRCSLEDRAGPNLDWHARSRPGAVSGREYFQQFPSSFRAHPIRVSATLLVDRAGTFVIGSNGEELYVW
jgi:hypothetical protein